MSTSSGVHTPHPCPVDLGPEWETTIHPGIGPTATVCHSAEWGQREDRTLFLVQRWVGGGVNCEEATSKQESDLGTAVEVPQDPWMGGTRILLQGLTPEA